MSRYLVGIDVGGTNTDAVLLDPNHSINNDAVLAWNKQLTTHNVSQGIESSLAELFKNGTEAYKSSVLSVTIGTTHFINAIVERDQSRLEKVAVLRLCGPYSHNAPPFSDFPNDLKKLLNGYVGLLKGGVHVDGCLIEEIDEDEVIAHANNIKELGIRAVAISGIFSPIFKDQEQKVSTILKRELPDTFIILSNELSGIGLLERENLTILNASVKRFANRIIKTFASAVKKSNIEAPILLTQNDGTVLTIEEALRIPIKTFASGTTNSMRGANFLLSKSPCQGLCQNFIVVDVGGTTTDVGLLLESGYPRKTSEYSFIGGVKTRLAMPQVESIGLGGGSIIRDHGNRVSIGPDSVGNDFNKSIVGGGDTWTTADIAVFSELANDACSTENNPIYALGDKSRVKGKVSKELYQNYSKELSKMIERVIDRMKTSPQDIPVLLVGGGSFILPNEISGASEVWRPKFYQVANAIGAAIGKISATAQAFAKQEENDLIIDSLTREATAKAIASGAVESTITIADIAVEEVPYTNMNLIEVKVISDVDYSKLKQVSQQQISSIVEYAESNEEVTKDVLITDDIEEDVDYEAYEPNVNNDKEWTVSEVDLEFLRVGTYILGCGGGGDPYPQYLIAKNVLKQGGVMKVVDVDHQNDYSSISAGFVGTPTVANERLQGSEITTAFNLLNFGNDIDTVVSLEIGGGNGFQGLLLGAQLNKKVLDGDLMGRAYPTIWQISPVVLSEESFYSPCAISDGNGNDIVVQKTKSNKHAESIIRAALTELGSLVGLVSLVKDAQKLVIRNSISLAWRIGRAVLIAKQKSDISNIPNYIIESLKPTTAKQIFEGKIISVEKKVVSGYVCGEVTIECPKRLDQLKIPFQNENLVASLNNKIIASVPDLISVIDMETGEALGTPDYKYGLSVYVMAISPSNIWTDTGRALDLGGPQAFDIPHQYKPIGRYEKPISVIEEFYS